MTKKNFEGYKNFMKETELNLKHPASVACLNEYEVKKE